MHKLGSSFVGDLHAVCAVKGKGRGRSMVGQSQCQVKRIPVHMKDLPLIHPSVG